MVSLTTPRVWEMSAGLLTSTVTPGRTPPELSVTVPAITLCAAAVMGYSTIPSRTPSSRLDVITRTMGIPPSC